MAEEIKNQILNIAKAQNKIEEDKQIESIKSEYFYTNDLRHNELVGEIALNRELIIELKKESDK